MSASPYPQRPAVPPPRAPLPAAPTTSVPAQPIAVRVMRLSRPSVSLNSSKLPLPIHGTPLDAPLHPPESVFGEDLAIPSVLGHIAVGEELCFLVSLGNISSVEVRNLKIRVELHKLKAQNSQSFKLLETFIDNSANPYKVVKAGERLEFICRATVKEDQWYSFVCSVTFDRVAVVSQDPLGYPVMNGPQTQSYSKHFKFPVINDVKVSTRTKSLFPEAGHTWLVEATVECLVPLHISSIRLVPDKSHADIIVEDIIPDYDSSATKPTPSVSSAAALAGAKWNLDKFPSHLPKVRDVKGLMPEKSVVHKTFCVKLNGTTTLPDTIGAIHLTGDQRIVKVDI